MTDADPHAGASARTCANSPTTGCPSRQRCAFIHQLLQRQMAEARMYLDRIERLRRTLDDARPARLRTVAQALEAIARDARRPRALSRLRTRCRSARGARAHARCCARRWVGCRTTELREELMRMFDEMLARNDRWRAGDVDLVCSLNAGRELDGALDSRREHRSTTSRMRRCARAWATPKATRNARRRCTAPRGQCRDRADLSAAPADRPTSTSCAMSRRDRAHESDRMRRCARCRRWRGTRLSDPEILDTLTRLYPGRRIARRSRPRSPAS